MAHEKKPVLKNLVVIDPIDDELKKRCEEAGLTVYTFQEVLDEGAKAPLVELPELNADTILTFCYTSGTTGDPKAAIISHGNILSIIAGSKALPPFTPEDVHLSYLPPAHIYERVAIWCINFFGGSIGTFNGNIKKLKFDLADLRPTFFISVPRLFNKLYDVMIGSKPTSQFLLIPRRDCQGHRYKKDAREQGHCQQNGRLVEGQVHQLALRSPGVQQDEGGFRRALQVHADCGRTDTWRRCEILDDRCLLPDD